MITLLGLLSLLACEEAKHTADQNAKKLDVNLMGNWEYMGFGKAISISDTLVEGYHIATTGNVPTSKNSAKYFHDYYTIDTLSNDTILLKDGVKTFKLFRTNKNFEQQVNKELANDPQYNFDILWNTFNEQYCYFKERNIDWDAIYKKYEPQVNPDTKPLELFLIFEKMLGEINDSHISIDVPDDLEKEYNAQSKKTDLEENNEDNGKLVKSLRNLILEKHVDQFKSFNKGSINYGKINEDIGYIEIQNMVAMAHYNIPDSLSNDEFWDQWWSNLNKAKNYHDDVRIGTQFMMNSIINDLGNVKACIIDLRFNGGGFDDASFEILNHFASNKIDVCTKKVRLGKGFTEKQVLSLYPSKKVFDGKLYILTSHQTASAAEVLVLGSKKIPNSTIIGSTTEGVFSDILDKKLPNGWTYGLSNMIYESMESISYENIGITPDYIINYPTVSKDFYKYLLEDLKNGDDAIEKVINKMEK